MRLNNAGWLTFLRTPLAFSLLIHLSIVLLILAMPAEKKKGAAPFITRLITPEELAGPKPAKQQSHAGAPAAIPQRGRHVLPGTKNKTAGPFSGGPAKPAVQQKAPMLPPSGAASTAPGSAPAQALPEGNQQANAPAGSGPVSVQAGKSPPLMGSLRRGAESALIDKIADKEALRKDNTVTFDTKEFRYQPYMARLKDKIEKAWEYPPDAAARGIYGDLDIQFTINKNGGLDNVELLKTSGHRSLDEAALSALRNAAPFFPLPGEWGRDSITIPGHFIYHIYGTVIR